MNAYAYVDHSCRLCGCALIGEVLRRAVVAQNNNSR